MFDNVLQHNGQEVYTYQHIEKLRDQNLHQPIGEKMYDIIPQKGFQEQVLTTQADFLIIGGKRGGGKMQPYSAKVLTPYGYTTMGALQVGTKILNPNGKTQTVTAIHEQGVQDIFEIKFDDGSKTECGLEHLWLTKTGTRKPTRLTADTKERPITTFDMIEMFEQRGKYRNKNGKIEKKRQIYIPANNPLTFNNKDHKNPLTKKHTYILGLLYADHTATIKNGTIYLDGTRPHIENILRIIGADYIWNIKTEKYEVYQMIAIEDYLQKENKYKTINKPTTRTLPTSILISSIRERQIFINGFTDMQNHPRMTNRKQNIHLQNQTLANQIVEIARSIGGKATKPTSTTPRKTKQLTFRTTITIPEEEKKHNATKYARRMTAYHYAGRKMCRCIQVSEKNGLYITDDYITTHNTFVMLLPQLYNYNNPSFVAHGFRREEADIRRGLWKSAKDLFEGQANFTEGNFTATFPTGAKITFEHLQDEKQIDRRFRGVEIPLIIIDELPQISFQTVFTLLGSNRNSLGIKNQLIASCNPVPKHNWVYKFIQWYIDPNTNEVIKERSGKIRYFYKYGSDISEIIWGETKKQVYKKAKQYIDGIFDKRLEKTGGSKYDLITSFAFIEGEYGENQIFRKKDPLYLGRLAQQGGRQSFKDIKGIWGDDEDGLELIQAEHIRKLIENTEQTNGIRTAVADVALSRDAFVIGAFDGNHLFEIQTFTNVGSDTAALLVKNFLEKNHISERNFLYDADGIGQYLKEKFKNSIGFNNNSPATDPQIWANKKAQCADKFCTAVREGKYSINKELLNRKMPSGRTIEEELYRQRQALVQKVTNKTKFQLIGKPEMRQIIGGKESPDLIDMLFMHENFNINKPKKKQGLWMLL